MLTDAWYWDLTSEAQRRTLLAAALPGERRTMPARRTSFRDVYLDTADGTLQRRGVLLRLRFGVDDRRALSIEVSQGPDLAPLRWDRRVRAMDVHRAVAESGAISRRLHALVDPALLQPHLELEVDRWVRLARHDWLHRPSSAVRYDHVTARAGGRTRDLWQLSVRRLRGPAARSMELGEQLAAAHGLAGSAHRGDGAALHLRWARAETVERTPLRSNQLHRVPGAAADLPDDLDPDLSLLAFQERVLAMAEDAGTPLRARLRYLGIMSANLDEFFMVRVAGLREATAELSEEQLVDGRTARERLDLIQERVSSISERQSRCLAACLSSAASLGVHLLGWHELTAAEHDLLGERFREDVLPALTPFAMTLTPGHPLPHLPHLTLALGVMLRSPDGGRPHFAEVELSRDLPRFVAVPGRDGCFVTLESLVRANLAALYPGADASGWAFRVTRGGGLGMAEDGVDDLLEAVEQASGRRGRNRAARLEVEAGMPLILRDLVLEDLRREAADAGAPLSRDDVEEVPGLLDMTRVAELELPDDPALDHPLVPGRDPLAGARVLDSLRARDLLVHHPFDAFDATVVRFLREAAEDPQTVAVKITLYRLGDASPVADALLAAARRGVEVVAFVELKARFDEERNVRWARELEAAGGRVVHGMKGLKTHAKASLVVRREDGQLRRYAHVGTGNYNARTARLYTDLSLLSARDAITADVALLFNALTGSARAPSPLAHGSLVAPAQMLPALLERIAREREHALAGRAARIRIKVNGLSDADVVSALYAASQAGVRVELVVRGICTLRPGVPGRSTGIRVVSVLGQLLEHSRIYHFANGGGGEYFIGSADLRPRNLRSRVELLVPVEDPDARVALDALLEAYLTDPGAWELTSGGEYARLDAGGARSLPPIQQRLAQGSAGISAPLAAPYRSTGTASQ